MGQFMGADMDPQGIQSSGVDPELQLKVKGLDWVEAEAPSSILPWASLGGLRTALLHQENVVQ